MNCSIRLYIRKILKLQYGIVITSTNFINDFFVPIEKLERKGTTCGNKMYVTDGRIWERKATE